MPITKLPTGQQLARTRWGTQESGAAFDRKKSPFLTEQARDFIAQQAMCVMVGLDTHSQLDGVLLTGQPGFIEVAGPSTCLLPLECADRAASLLRRLQTVLASRQKAWVSLFLICHSTRQRLCIHGTVEALFHAASPLPSSYLSENRIRLLIRVQEAFFHCPKYIRTQVPGLTGATSLSSQQQDSWRPLREQHQQGYSEELCRFLFQQVLCFLCTVNRDGRCAVNHRGGRRGFLVPYPPGKGAPAGIVLLPDYAGNGAFEAIGNIFETQQASLIVPDYTAQLAVCLSGAACVVEPKDLRQEVAERCAGAERVVALAVQRVQVQSGGWSPAPAYEHIYAEAPGSPSPALSLCPVF